VRSRILEVLTHSATIVFDKTGTLTEGRPTVTETTLFTESGERNEGFCLSLAAEIETVSEHVLARAFARHYKAGAFDSADFQTVPGCGVEAVIDGVKYRLGNARYVVALCDVAEPNEHTTNESTTVYLGDENGLVAKFTIGDELRVDAVQAIADLQQLGYDVAIASGDREPAVAAAAAALGIPKWYSRLGPVEKLQLVSDLQGRGETVVMVGDGINDAPVLAAADASIAIDAGTALARASADAVVLGKRLGSVVDAARIATRTKKIIRQNITWAILYNVIAVPMAVSGVLAPWMAAVGMSVSSLVVVVNALRLQGAGSTQARFAMEQTSRRAAEEAVV